MVPSLGGTTVGSGRSPSRWIASARCGSLAAPASSRVTTRMSSRSSMATRSSDSSRRSERRSRSTLSDLRHPRSRVATVRTREWSRSINPENSRPTESHPRSSPRPVRARSISPASRRSRSPPLVRRPRRRLVPGHATDRSSPAGVLRSGTMARCRSSSPTICSQGCTPAIPARISRPMSSRSSSNPTGSTRSRNLSPAKRRSRRTRFEHRAPNSVSARPPSTICSDSMNSAFSVPSRSRSMSTDSATESAC